MVQNPASSGALTRKNRKIERLTPENELRVDHNGETHTSAYLREIAGI
jgi:hypothetical protein